MLQKTESTHATGDLLYLAFRASYVTSFHQLMNEFNDNEPRQSRGFMDHIKLAVGCAPQIQLDLLLRTWKRLSDGGALQLSLIDQCVCYCATCELAFCGETENRHRIIQSANGPRVLAETDVVWLASKLRTVQITWPFPMDSAVLLRDAEFLSSELEQCRQPGSQHEAVISLLDLVGAWQVTPQILSNANGLLTADETHELGVFFQNHPRLMNL